MTFINSKDPRFCDSTRDLKNATRPNNFHMQNNIPDIKRKHFH